MASGNYADVRFDFEGSLRLARSLWAYADELEAAKGIRRTDADDALRSWRGPYGDEFRERTEEELQTIGALIAGLRSDADAWARAWKDAMDEQNRRLHARRVDALKAERSMLEKAGDFFTGFDYPPEPPPVPKPAPAMFHATSCLTG